MFETFGGDEILLPLNIYNKAEVVKKFDVSQPPEQLFKKMSVCPQRWEDQNNQGGVDAFCKVEVSVLVPF